MAEHLLIGDIAALLLVLGMTGPLLAPLLRNPVIAKLRVLTHPVVAIVVWAVNFYAWHSPVLYQAALRHDALHALEHATFLAFGICVWMALLGPLPEAGLVQQRRAARLHHRRAADRHRAGQHPDLRRHRLLPDLPRRRRPLAHLPDGRPGRRRRPDDGRGEPADDRALLLAVPCASRASRRSARRCSTTRSRTASRSTSAAPSARSPPAAATSCGSACARAPPRLRAPRVRARRSPRPSGRAPQLIWLLRRRWR